MIESFKFSYEAGILSFQKWTLSARASRFAATNQVGVGNVGTEGTVVASLSFLYTRTGRTDAYCAHIRGGPNTVDKHIRGGVLWAGSGSFQGHERKTGNLPGIGATVETGGRNAAERRYGATGEWGGPGAQHRDEDPSGPTFHIKKCASRTLQADRQPQWVRPDGIWPEKTK